MSDDFDATLTALLAEPETDEHAFAERVIRRLDQRDSLRTLVLGGFGAAGLAIFAWQLVAHLDAVGATLHMLFAGDAFLPLEIGAPILFAAMLTGMLAGGGARGSGAAARR